MTKSYRPTEEYLNQNRQTVVIDASGLVLGRLAARIAHILKGKHKVFYTPGTDCGDRVVVFNTDNLRITGKKLDNEIFYKHTGYIGNMKKIVLRDRMEKNSGEVLETCVKRMLSKGVLTRRQFKRLDTFTKEITSRIQNKVELNLNQYFRSTI